MILTAGWNIYKTATVDEIVTVQNSGNIPIRVEVGTSEPTIKGYKLEPDKDVNVSLKTGESVYVKPEDGRIGVAVVSDLNFVVNPNVSPAIQVAIAGLTEQVNALTSTTSSQGSTIAFLVEELSQLPTLNTSTIFQNNLEIGTTEIMVPLVEDVNFAGYQEDITKFNMSGSGVQLFEGIKYSYSPNVTLKNSNNQTVTVNFEVRNKAEEIVSSSEIEIGAGSVSKPTFISGFKSISFVAPITDVYTYYVTATNNVTLISGQAFFTA